MQLAGNAAKGFEIGRDVITRRAVASRDSERKFSIAIVNTNGNTVPPSAR